ncbi:hypothetical protein [Sphingobacterium corticibacter]|uniref:Uncharacterized protein n=1 Tax=Sphingobacterium corticibacter TaxID=2171749 RepID=A0A2T8HFF3_9SPHI|nr:hypothetical protein [Sphingobacterium corticibacter]PVH24156.1 hypothetical protein DC487_15590 [Sphingobacterium corticibacter]
MKKLFFTLVLVGAFAFAKAEAKPLSNETKPLNSSVIETLTNTENVKLLKLTPEEANRIIASSQFNGKNVAVKQAANDILIIIWDDGEIWIIFY